MASNIVKNGAIAQTAFATKTTSTPIAKSHIEELRNAIANLNTYITHIDNCGNCTASNCCQSQCACQSYTCQSATCQTYSCQSATCQTCQACQGCQTCQSYSASCQSCQGCQSCQYEPNCNCDSDSN